MSENETVPLPDGKSAEIRTSLTGADQRWFFVTRDRLMQANGTGKPARQELDPDNPAVMIDLPAEPAYLTVEDNFRMIDLVAGRLLVSSTRPGIVPWVPPKKGKDGQPDEPGTRDTTDLDVVNAIDNALAPLMDRLRGVVPKTRTTGPTSADTSTQSAAAPQAAPTPAPSSTAPAS